MVRTFRVPAYAKRQKKRQPDAQIASRSMLERTWCQGLDDGSASDGTKNLNDRQNRSSHGTQRADEEHAESDRVEAKHHRQPD